MMPNGIDRRRLGLGAVLAAAMLAVAAPSFADPAQSKIMVDAAKARGEVGEQGDGYLGPVNPGASAEVRAALAEINAGRAEAYRDTASKTGVTPEAAGQATARQLFARLPSGQYYKPLDGAWMRK
jgi:uncharacterized protein YdbL (DUF1318 family)